MSFKLLSTDHNGHAIQGFAPTKIESISSGSSLDTSNVIAIRVPSDVQYYVNGAGDEGTMPAGVTVVSINVTSFQFASAVVIEVME